MATISDWIIEMQIRGLKTAKTFYTDKLEDYRRLKSSGLPVFADFLLPLDEFEKGNNDLEDFLAKYNGFVIRAVPCISGLPRKYKVGVRSFEECLDFLRGSVEQKNQGYYRVLLTENEASDWAGIILSRDQDCIIEVARAGLDELSHGQVIPVGGHFAYHDFNHFRSMRYTTENPEERGLMWNVLQLLKKTSQGDSDLFPSFDFRKGYFEFIRTLAGRIKFLDFKTNPAYVL